MATGTISTIKTILGITDDSEDERLEAYLAVARQELISWRYASKAEEVEEIPYEYEMTLVYAVVAGYSQGGAENQTQHSENGINRTFRFSDMIEYIRSNVVPLCKVV